MAHLYTNEELVKAMDAAPMAVQQAIESKKTLQAIREIGATYKLHIDQLGRVAELNTQMLLGIVRPAEFLGGLLMAGIPEPEARQIMGEINEKIFKPLQQQMREQGPGGAGVPQPTPPPPALTPVPPAPQYAPPAPRYAPPQPAPMPAPQPRQQMAPPPQVPQQQYVPPAPQLRPMPPPPSQSSITLPPAPQGVGPRPLTPSPQWQGGAPLPPRTVLPGASAPRFIKPMQAPQPGMTQEAPAWEPVPAQIQQNALPYIPQRGAPPPNLPTYAPPAAPQGAAQPDGRAFNVLPPLAKPKPPSSGASAGETPNPEDPYREPLQ